MTKEQFVKTYCMNCGTQRCEGIDTEWGEGCQYRWNLDGVDAAAEVKHLNDKIIELGYKLLKAGSRLEGKWIEHVEKPDWLEDDVEVYYTCSCCGINNFGESPYCPNCGAHMTKED